MTIDTTPAARNTLAHNPFAKVYETHTGVVLLLGDRAYKLKKPIVTDFLDFGSAAAREHACARELELNRRLAPDVYLGLAQLSDPTGGPDEPVLVMRRMPADRRLSDLLAAGRLSHGELATLATTLAEFHRTAARGPAIDHEGGTEALRKRWRILLDSLAAQPPGAIEPERLAHADRLAMRFLDGRDTLFESRIRLGHIVDGHGDLLAEDIFALDDGFRILDCLDFDDTLRYVDVLDDAAFLAMDLEFRGHPELAAFFLDSYLHAAVDSAPDALRHHYIAYRALVRAKTDRLRAAQGDPDAAASARRHLDLAIRHLERGAVTMVLVGGLPGSGKSTVARELAAHTGARVISSDAVRAQLRACGAVTGASGRFGEGAYRPEARARVYAELLDRARADLALGRSVILDAGWPDAETRARAAEIADLAHADLIPLHCACPSALAASRILGRPHGDSEATPAIADALAATVTDWPDAVQLDTAGPVEATVAAALRIWNGHRHS
ncbi:uncharacterized protein NS506_04339 [Nocardia seriolae]|uniref:Gluconate kinase n=1 Tax=Nocardia seriolae TaxID=37332 RepID=A0ABC9YWE9_9NOCA|nr:AAA family ATPase [Nocardia seriolae]APA98387.1 uncharacterized protein NS506_04339 [Nocardia seriolae]BEK95458.1 AAA family ATPase [Nocardia seriolae]GAM47850.1 hypothetical protein NS07_v2contig00059-0021 [Nocardia seriolae]GAP29709.1 hypothetical protein NSK11_contig00062-0017 [Nocardia seriolae]